MCKNENYCKKNKTKIQVIKTTHNYFSSQSKICYKKKPKHEINKNGSGMKRNEKVSTEEMMLYERDDDQNLPVHLAVENQHIDIVNYLVNLASDKGKYSNFVLIFSNVNYYIYFFFVTKLIFTKILNVFQR